MTCCHKMSKKSQESSFWNYSRFKTFIKYALKWHTTCRNYSQSWPTKQTKNNNNNNKLLCWFSFILFCSVAYQGDIQWLQQQHMTWIRRYEQKKLNSKISVDFNSRFTSYAWLCVFCCTTIIVNDNRPICENCSH